MDHPGAASKAYARNGLNQYTNISGTGLAYDARGNMTIFGSRTFSYDIENRLTTAGGPALMTLAYDPGGRLRQAVAGGATTQFLYGGNALLVEYDGTSGAMLRRYVHGPGVDEPLVWYEGSGLTDKRYLIADRQGSIIAAEGATTTRYTYGPYGEPGTWTGSRFRYTGQIMLPEVQLYHYKARAYDPVLGRFLQTDPVGYADQMNLYAYVGNDPLNAADPSGMRQDGPGVERRADAAAELGRVFGGTLVVLKEHNRELKQESAERSNDPTFIGGDQDAHCQANCVATQDLGAEGSAMAEALTTLKEAFDTSTGRNSQEESDLDQDANRAGREIGSSGGQCKAGCAAWVRENVNENYEPDPITEVKEE